MSTGEAMKLDAPLPSAATTCAGGARTGTRRHLRPPVLLPRTHGHRGPQSAAGLRPLFLGFNIQDYKEFEASL